MMIPSEDGPKASVRVSKETVSRKVQYSVFIDALFWGKLTINQLLKAHCDRLALRNLFHVHLVLFNIC